MLRLFKKKPQGWVTRDPITKRFVKRPKPPEFMFPYWIAGFLLGALLALGSAKILIAFSTVKGFIMMLPQFI